MASQLFNFSSPVRKYIELLLSLLQHRCGLHILKFQVKVLNPIALRTTKTLRSFGRSECNRVNLMNKVLSGELSCTQTCLVQYSRSLHIHMCLFTV